MQLDVVLALIDLCVRSGGVGERLTECLQEFLRGIGYWTEATAASRAALYIKADEEFSRPLLEQHPFIMENYLLNYVYRTLFPFGRQASAHHTVQSIMAEYMLMAAQYSMIHGLLIGVAGHYRENFGTEHVVKLVQSFSKAVEHNPAYLKEISKFVTARNLTTEEGIAMLLKSSMLDSRRLAVETRRRLPVPEEQPAIA